MTAALVLVRCFIIYQNISKYSRKPLSITPYHSTQILIQTHLAYKLLHIMESAIDPGSSQVNVKKETFTLSFLRYNYHWIIKNISPVTRLPYHTIIKARSCHNLKTVNISQHIQCNIIPIFIYFIDNWA